MNRKLLILNLVLGAAVIYAGVELHGVYVAAKARQARMPGPAPKPPAVPAVPPLPQQPAVLPSGYVKVAANDLFDASRNPDLPLPEPPKPAPPPEPPPLPSYYGLMNLGDPQGPIAMIREAGIPGYKEVHAGEMIGEFKLVAFDRQEMTLDWQGKIIHKRLGEDTAETSKPKAPADAATPNLVPGIMPGLASKEPERKIETRELGPGPALNDNLRVCQPGDSSPVGTVSGGYRKETIMGPVGAGCFWRAVGK